MMNELLNACVLDIYTAAVTQKRIATEVYDLATNLETDRAVHHVCKARTVKALALKRRDLEDATSLLRRLQEQMERLIKDDE